MADIRDRLEREIARLIKANVKLSRAQMTSPEVIAKNILSIPELAIVDTKAKLPTNLYMHHGAPKEKYDVYRRAQQDMLEDGYVKEVTA